MTSAIFTAAQAHIEGLTQYHFTNARPLKEALLACPEIMIDGYYMPEYNKRLAIIGDAAIALLVTKHCYSAGMSKGTATVMKSSLVSNVRLAKVGRANGIEHWIVKNGGMLEPSEYMMATAIEAIVGAVFVDSAEDYAITKRAMIGLGVLIADFEVDSGLTLI